MACIRKLPAVFLILLVMIVVPANDHSTKSFIPGQFEDAYGLTDVESSVGRPGNPPLPDTPEEIETPEPAVDRLLYQGQPNTGTFKQNVSVMGRVVSEFGEVLGLEKITFHSPNQHVHYTTHSNEYGEYTFNNVPPGKDYVINVSPTKMYKRYTRTYINIDYGQNLYDIIVESIPLGVLTGIVLDSYERPVSNLPLRLRTLEKDFWSTTVTTDANGAFAVPQFPKGRFDVISAGQISFTAAGMNFDPDSGGTVSFNIDLGPHSLGGRIFDQFGQAFDGASVVVMWSDRKNEISVRSTRHVNADISGNFRFTGLGPGNHHLIVSAWNDKQFKKTVKQVINLGVDSGELNILIDTL